MNFLTPAFLALAALAAPIIILYMLRLRRREVTVSSTMLWQRLMQDREANTPWQKLRRNLLLLLQLLILLTLVIALARPFIPVPSVAAGSVAVLLDASASMNAADLPGGQTRFAAAVDAARDLVTDLGANDTMTVIAVGPTPDVLSPPTSDRAALREALNRAQPTRAAADWDAALALAGASIAGREDAAIIIISDGGLPTDLPAVPAETRYVAVGRQAQNLAITALAVRPLDDTPQLFAAVHNYGSQDAAVILSIEVDGQLQTAERLGVPAGETADLTITDLPADPGVIRAELTAPVEGSAPDYLPVDDVAYTVYTPPAGGRVLLVTEGNLFFEQVLTALPTIEAFKAPPGDLPGQDFNLVILDGWLPDELPDTNLLIIAPPETTNLFAVRGLFEDTRFLRQADDPILTFVDFRDVAVREAVRVEAPGWARTLVEAEGGPLLLAGNAGGQRVAILTFDIHASDLPLQIGFPILVANLLEWYSPARPFDAPAGLAPGEPVTIRPQASTTDYRITYPDGSRQTFPVREDTLTFAQTAQPGVYAVELLDGSEVTTGGQFAVNLFSPAESDITPRPAITIGQADVTPARPEDEYGERELWPFLAAAALAVLALEWFIYHRGTRISRREPEPGQRRPGLFTRR